jgi:hypothetical protein
MTADYAREIAAAAAANGLSPEIFAAQVVVESSGHADAFRFEPGILAQIEDGRLKPRHLPANPVPRRMAASYGLTQILYITACDYGFAGDPEELFVPERSLHYGARHLAVQLAWAGGDYARALAAYNGGRRGNVAPPPAESSVRGSGVRGDARAVMTVDRDDLILEHMRILAAGVARVEQGVGAIQQEQSAQATKIALLEQAQEAAVAAAKGRRRSVEALFGAVVGGMCTAVAEYFRR